jgi:serine/threonine protein kinase
VVQQEVAASRSRRSSSLLGQAQPDLVLQELLGRGGFGCVYRGTYNGAAVALKVMEGGGDSRQALKDATEMAVLASISHPNVVQVGGWGRGRGPGQLA